MSLSNFAQRWLPKSSGIGPLFKSAALTANSRCLSLTIASTESSQIHVLEHLPNLPAFLAEARRLLNPSGRLLVVIPCEGGWGYSAGRRVTSKRMFERRYRTPYEPFIAAEHVNKANEILEELERYFVVEKSEYYPMKVPVIHLNLCIGLTLSAL